MLGEFTWTSAGAWGSFLTLLALIIRQVGPWRKQTMDAEKVFRDELMSRVVGLEEKLEKKEAQLERKDAIHQAERALDRHKINNLQACFDSVLNMMEMSPERAQEIAVKVRQMREAQMMAEAEEKARISVAIIEAAEKTAVEEAPNVAH